MVKKWLLCLCSFCVVQAFAQLSSTDPEFEAQPVGGKEQLEQVLQTQFILPKMVLASDFETTITLFFNIDSIGNAFNFKSEGTSFKVVTNELQRTLKYLKFKRTLHLPNEPRPYFLTFHLSRDKYNRYYKQRSKLNFKKPVPADSSYTVYSRADRSPEYFKNGEEGLKEHILSSLTYPKIAIEKSIEGTVVIEFVVETNGYVTNVVTLQQVNAGCTEEALRIIKETKWQPAVFNNKLVRYKMTYPITFSLRNTLHDYGTSTSPTGQ